MFFKGSRYADVQTLSYTDSKGRVLRYKNVRLIEEPSKYKTHRTIEGERLDLIAERYYRDPERFWRICDANLADWPADLVSEAGRKIEIPLPEE